MELLQPAKAYFGSIRAYKLVEIRTLVANQEKLAAVLFDIRKPYDERVIFAVHPTSGYLFYADYSAEAEAIIDGKLPRSQKEVERIALQFLAQSNYRVAANPALRRAGISRIFPDDLRPVSIGVIGLGKPQSHLHWICVFSAYLPADKMRVARVEGAIVEIRVGRRGKIIGLSSRWRPVSGDLLADELEDPSIRGSKYFLQQMQISPVRVGEILKPKKPDPIRGEVPIPLQTSMFLTSHEHEHEHESHSESDEELVFQLADERDDQKILGPMYLTADGHHGTVGPASRHSLCVEIYERTVQGGTEVMADVRGGTGSFDYRWRCRSLDDISASGADVSDSVSARLEPGSYSVAVSVRDLLTGARAISERSVISGMQHP